MMHNAILVLDCGATNVKACLVDSTGEILASRSMPNETIPDPDYPGGLIWDPDNIWNKLTACSRMVCQTTPQSSILGITVTSFGVDGAVVKKDGMLCHPVISWQCGRTDSIERNIGKYFDRDWLYAITGLQSYHFNTIHKLIWLKENRKEVLEEMDYYVLMPSLFLHRLSGEYVTDATMAGTTMLTRIRDRAFSEEILGRLELSANIFPPWVEPGTQVGRVTAKAAELLGVRPGIPVLAAGHDTQFAILASGAGIDQPVLSSGTWEILMVRTSAQALVTPKRESGITVELDTVPGLVNPGVQWVASGVLEWIARLFYPNLEKADAAGYAVMVEEAHMVPAGSNGVRLVPEIFPGGFSGRPGSLTGFNHETNRAQIYRAGLEALSFYLAYGLEKLEQVSGSAAKSLICVGGGSKNPLWNQIRADVTGIPVKICERKETTALGAAMVAFTGLGMFGSIEEALQNTKVRVEQIEPGPDRQKYCEYYAAYRESVLQ